MPNALLFALTSVATWLAAARVARRWTDEGWPQVAAAAGLLGATAALVPALCGLTGAGTSPVALATVTLALALGAAAAAGRPAHRDLSASVSPWAVAGGGAALAVAIHQTIYPRIRTDGFHLVEVVRWLHDGSPGALISFDPELPVEHYPLVNELILTWGVGLADGFGPVALWACALLCLLGASAYCAARAFAVSQAGAALGAAAVIGLTVSTVNVEGSATGYASAAWTVAAVSLLIRPVPVLGPGALLAGLAIGTKTNAAFVLLPVLVWAAARGRSDRRALPGYAVGLLVAAPWPIRNMLMHGSPLWPFSRPFGLGDPLPPVLREYQSSFADAPAEALRAYLSEQPAVLIRMLAALGAGVAALRAGPRPARMLAALGIASALLWALGPLSGPVDGGVSRSQLAYALPALLTCLVAAAVSTSPVARLLLSAVVVGSALSLGDGWPFQSWPQALAFTFAGAVGGVTVVPALRSLRGAPAAGVVAVAMASLTLLGSQRFTDPPLGVDGYAPLLRHLSAQPAYREGNSPVLSDIQDARWAGPRLDHPVRPLPERPDCARLMAVDAWVVIFRQERFGSPPVPAARCFSGVAPSFESSDARIFRTGKG